MWGIFFSAFLIGFSGAIMPGPMLGITIDGSIKNGYKVGPLMVLGHGILELSLIAVMLVGLKDFFANLTVAGFLGIFGGAFLGWMGFDMVKSSIKKTVSLNTQNVKNSKGRNFILSGLIVSASNPYFILWWATTGIESMRQAYTLGLLGIMFFFAGHILADLTWYSAISITFASGKKLFSDTVYRWIILFLGLFIIVFSTYFIIGGWKMLFPGFKLF